VVLTREQAVGRVPFGGHRRRDDDDVGAEQLVQVPGILEAPTPRGQILLEGHLEAEAHRAAESGVQPLLVGLDPGASLLVRLLGRRHERPILVDVAALQDRPRLQRLHGEAHVRLERLEGVGEEVGDDRRQGSPVGEPGCREHASGQAPRRRKVDGAGRQRRRVTRRGPGRHREQQAQVGDRRRQRTVGGEIHPRRRPVAGDEAVRRLQPGEAAERGRDADRPATVARRGDRHVAGGQGGGGAAAGAAGRPLRRPRVPRHAIDEVRGEALEAELGDVGLTDDDRPGAPQTRDVQTVARRRRRVGERQRALGAGQSRDIVGLLGQQRQAGERPQALAARRGRIDRVRLGERLIGAQTDDGVQNVVLARDLVQRPLNELARRHLPRPHQPGKRLQHVVPSFIPPGVETGPPAPTGDPSATASSIMARAALAWPAPPSPVATLPRRLVSR